MVNLLCRGNAATLETFLKQGFMLPVVTKSLKDLGRHISAVVRFVLVIALLIISSASYGQSEKWDSLMNLAKAYHQQKNYSKSNECYEKAIEAIRPYDNNIINKIKGFIALNYLYQGVPLFKENKYLEAKPFFDKAIEYAEKDAKVYHMANSWMGNWYSRQALDIRVSETNLQQAVDYYIEAEKYFELANAPEKRLGEQVSRATVLGEISRIDEAKQLLRLVISEAEKDDKRIKILAKALNELGSLELNSENYYTAIEYLERSYNLSLTNDKQNAWIAANRLQRLYKNQIPDKSKTDLWEHRADELKECRSSNESHPH